MNRILIGGIGNIFFGDDAFGVEVAQRLQHRTLPEGVKVRDFGIRSYDLAFALLEPYDAIILVDILKRGEAPGTVSLIEPEWPAGDLPAADLPDPHNLDPMRVLRLARSLGEPQVGRLLMVGCEPESASDDSGGMELSPSVRAAVPEAIRLIEDLVGNMQMSKPALMQK